MVTQSLTEEVKALDEECAQRVQSFAQRGVGVQIQPIKYVEHLLEELLGEDRVLAAKKKHFESLRSELDSLETEVRKRRLLAPS